MQSVVPFIRKIYYNDKPLILTTDAAAVLDRFPLAKGYLRFEGAFARNYRLAVQHLMQPKSLGVIIEDASQTSLLSELHARYEPINAAGGVVTNEDGAVLLIFRRGRWDLPKGKQDEGETIDQCAVREVMEETGLVHVTLGKHLVDTYHVYSQKGQSLLKRTVWYAMVGTKKDKLIPQAGEAILEARWVDQTSLTQLAFKSYEAVREVIASMDDSAN